MRLPVDAHLPEILAALRSGGAVVVEAPPGTGKTTRIPPALLDAVEGEIWVLEPRRIAARAAAARVASERGEAVGETIGYAMRFDRRASARTRVLYVTEALLTRRLAESPGLEGIGAVVLDEFHERSIHADIALAAVRMLRRRRPALAVVVMSATLDGEGIARFLGCPLIRVESPLFPVEVVYYPRRDERPVEARVAAAVRSVAQGDILAFLPGVGEIERTAALLAGMDAEVVPLHGELAGEAQDRALSGRGARRRVILATNVAETSVTVEGVTTVIDAGLARVAGHDPWSGLGTLELQAISRASAIQRAGRAGRTEPGSCLRLYTRGEFDARAAETIPEIRRVDLAGTVLDLRGRALEWLDAPSAAAWRSAVELLERLGALEGTGLSAIGEAMARLPLAPRVARVLVESVRRGVGSEGTVLATLFGERRRPTGTAPVVDLLDAALAGRADRRELRQLEGAIRTLAGGPRPRDPHEALLRSLLAGFPDRVGKRRGNTVVLAEGGSAALDPGTPGEDGFVVVTEAERVGTASVGGGRTRVRSMTYIPADWLLDASEVRETLSFVGERVEAREQLCFGALVIEEALGRGDPEAVAALLHEHAAPIAHRLFPDHDRAAAMVERAAFLVRAGFDLPALALDGLVRAGCAGCRCFGDLGAVSLVACAREALGASFHLLDGHAPEAIALPGRARVPVAYPAEGTPFVASRMQDFFGLKAGPSVGGRPLVLHLLAPNGRPVQVTTDLAGFWERHYPGIRRELMRRYPRQKWPEDPVG